MDYTAFVSAIIDAMKDPENRETIKNILFLISIMSGSGAIYLTITNKY